MHSKIEEQFVHSKIEVVHSKERVYICIKLSLHLLAYHNILVLPRSLSQNKTYNH